MIKRKSIIGICMLCALISAFAAQSASATTKGTTAFTCVTKAGGAFLGDHCLTSAEGGSGGASEHVAIPTNTTTNITATNANTASGTTAASPLILKVTIAGTPLELTATTVSGEGSLENKQAGSGEHYARDDGTMTMSGVTVTKPAGKGCKVYTDNSGVEGEEGVIHTNPLKATTEGQGDFLKFEPKEGTTFTTFIIKCEAGVPEALVGTYTLTGSIKCPLSGPTIKCSHEETTTQNTLKAKGTKAGFEGSVTLTGRHPGLDPEGAYNPVAVTTVETP